MTTTVEFVSYGSLAVSIIGVVGLGIRTAMAHGSAGQRLSALEDWQRCKSVDRFELDDLTKRVAANETDTVKAADGVNELRVQFAAIPGELRSIRDLMERDGRDTRHDISGLRMGMEKLADLIRSGPKA